MILIFFILGLLIGSFLNVCILRIPKGQSVVLPPSSCGACKSRLKAVDLIPLVSYMLSRGKCRHCGARFSFLYALGELFTGLLFLALYSYYGVTLQGLVYTLLICTLYVIAVIDYNHQIIPNGLSLLVLGISILVRLLIADGSFVDGLWGLLAGGGFLLLVAVVSNGGMGGGDIKLMGALGVALGLQLTVLAMFLSFLFGGVLSIGLLVLKCKKKGDPIPFGPFLILGFLVANLYGTEIIRKYFELFL